MPLAVSPASAAGRPKGGTSSVFVDLDTDRCRVITKPTSADGGDFGSWACGRRVGGWAVHVEYGDSRESITLVRRGTEYPLNLWTTVSGFFSDLGPRFEFRVRGGAAIAGIVRFNHAISGDSQTFTSELVVVKLGPTPCVTSVVPAGPSQNAEARILADRADRLGCRPDPTTG